MSERKRIVSLIVGLWLALATLSLAGPATAAADDADYLYDLSNAGIGGPRDKLLEVGHGACGKSRDVAIASIKQATSLVEEDAGFLYDSAIKFVCS
jgi:hypothetical protein